MRKALGDPKMGRGGPFVKFSQRLFYNFREKRPKAIKPRLQTQGHDLISLDF